MLMLMEWIRTGPDSPNLPDLASLLDLPVLDPGDEEFKENLVTEVDSRILEFATLLHTSIELEQVANVLGDWGTQMIPGEIRLAVLPATATCGARRR